MLIWYIIGVFTWILCILLMLAVFKGGHRNRGRSDEAYLRYLKNRQNGRDIFQSDFERSRSVSPNRLEMMKV